MPALECKYKIVIGHHYLLFYSHLFIYLGPISLALYPHNVNKLVLIVSNFTWPKFYLNRKEGHGGSPNVEAGKVVQYQQQRQFLCPNSTTVCSYFCFVFRVLFAGACRHATYCVFHKQPAPRMTARETSRTSCEGGKMPHGRPRSTVKAPLSALHFS
jgi:hypothetical protein